MQVLLILAGLIIDLLFDTGFRLSLKFLIDDILVRKDEFLMGFILAALAGGGAIDSLLIVARDYLYARVGSGVLNDIRASTFTHLQRLSIGFFTRAQVGDIIARFTTDLSAIESALVQSLPSAVMSILGLIVTTIPLFILEWRLALLAILGLPFCLLGPRLLEGRASAAGYRLKEEQARVTSLVQENISAQAVIKAFSLENSALAQFRSRIAALFGISVRSSFLFYLMESTPNIASLILELLVVGSGAFFAFKGYITIGTLVSFYVLFLSVNHSVWEISWILPSLVQAGVGLSRIEEITNETPQVSDSPEASALSRFRGEISFRDVTFGYAPDQVALQNINLTIPCGSSVAFVGPSGSGKSTILNLILRFYDPTRGTISFDGIDLRQATQESLRDQVGVVFQESFLFDTSIRENIRAGRRGASDKEVEEAARAAEIHEFIAGLPRRYDTVVGERGGRLSGGERQRVALARAILRNPSILVLDEATSALDPSTEAAIYSTLERLSEGRTVISVTHRLSTVINMDRIYVLDMGRVVEEGTHSGLLNLKGTYYRMWQEFTYELTQEILAREQVEVEDRAAAPGMDETEELNEQIEALRKHMHAQDQEIRRLQAINQRWAQLTGTERATGLPNKIVFQEVILPRLIQQAAYRGENVGLILASIDKLGAINETCGWHVGDQVLARLSQFLHSVLKGEEQMGQVDGMRLAVALQRASLPEARERAETLREAVAAQGLRCSGLENPVTISAGVISIDCRAVSDVRAAVDETFRRLHMALYRAKRAGGNRVAAD
jgi:ATP-binding cassette subfamily B protein